MKKSTLYLKTLYLLVGTVFFHSNPENNHAFRQCTTQASSSGITYGTCYSATECVQQGGTVSGNCASGFGVCCYFL